MTKNTTSHVLNLPVGTEALQALVIRYHEMLDEVAELAAQEQGLWVDDIGTNEDGTYAVLYGTLSGDNKPDSPYIIGDI